MTASYGRDQDALRIAEVLKTDAATVAARVSLPSGATILWRAGIATRCVSLRRSRRRAIWGSAAATILTSSMVGLTILTIHPVIPTEVLSPPTLPRLTTPLVVLFAVGIMSIISSLLSSTRVRGRDA